MGDVSLCRRDNGATGPRATHPDPGGFPLKALPRLFFVTLLAITATGCVFIDGEHVDMDDWRSEQDDNREAISQLSIGMSREAVVDRCGTP
ncbi:MAG TPA: hypothetical protein DD491_05295, partial [Halieaceae bacterium]|nr:hypothetical protein [Halieaceae bacterium]